MVALGILGTITRHSLELSDHMNKSPLLLPQPPYLHVTSDSVSDLTNFGWSLAKETTFRVVVRFLRGNKMTKVGSLFDEVSAALQFPYYFGENWNAFDECICDLAWIPADIYTLIVIHSEALLSEDSEEQLDAFISTLQRAGDEWQRAIHEGDAWDRPPVAFHVLFQCEGSKGVVESRLRSLGAEFDEV